MKIIVVGGGASGLVSALAIKEKKPNYDVLVIDR
ncbi:MAG: NAD(P)-binding protein, partial [Bacilli bacterium]|nr:NAD(P)-binding protein [Bacilli bacterium]